MATANHYLLSGGDLHVDYFETAIDGRPLLSYQNAHGTQTFHGEDIELSSTLLGTLVSVTIRRTVDTGSTSFSVLLPAINVEQGAMPLNTIGITALHRYSVLPALMRGQLDTYSVAQLHGSAEIVET